MILGAPGTKRETQDFFSFKNQGYQFLLCLFPTKFRAIYFWGNLWPPSEEEIIIFWLNYMSLMFKFEGPKTSTFLKLPFCIEIHCKYFHIKGGIKTSPRLTSHMRIEAMRHMICNAVFSTCSSGMPHFHLYLGNLFPILLMDKKKWSFNGTIQIHGQKESIVYNEK